MLPGSELGMDKAKINKVNRAVNRVDRFIGAPFGCVLPIKVLLGHRVQRFVRRAAQCERIYGRGIFFVKSAMNFWSIDFPPSLSAARICFHAPA